MHLSRRAHLLRQNRNTDSTKCSFNRRGDSEGHFVNALQPSTCFGQVPIKMYKLSLTEVFCDLLRIWGAMEDN